MANLSKIKRDEMIAFLNELKQTHSDDASIRAFNMIENHLREKKYGLVWEEHSEEVDELLKENIPVLTADPERRLCKDETLPWNFIIEGDNLQALYLLEKTHRGKVDCIYIDPPYNSGATDWKYNNDYVEKEDSYRHSKWLSMIGQRLKIAKKVLNPSTGVLICTIDEHEVHHLRCLLEELFPEAFIQMATIVINKKGVAQGRLARVEEYALYVFMPNAFVPAFHDDMLSQTELATTIAAPRWERLLRGGNNSRREDRPKMFYPVYIDPDKKKVTGIGPIMPLEEKPDLSTLDDRKTAWPIRSDGSLGHWQLQPSTFQELLDLGYVKVGTYDKKRKTWTILYLNKGTRKRIDEGEIVITGRDEVTGAVSVAFTRAESKMYNIKTVWFRKMHDSGIYGSTLLAKIIGRDVKFDFPKSIYSTKDAIAHVVRDKPNALILDFFAGSGTTLNAVNLLNSEDKGNRQCILVTNNECSEADMNQLNQQGYTCADKEWQAKGICQAITWPRTKYTIMGKRDNGVSLQGEYYTDLTEMIPFKKQIKQISLFDTVSDLKIKKELVSLVSRGTIPQKIVNELPFVVSDNTSHHLSIIFDITNVDDWIEKLEGMNHITDLFVVTSNKKKFAEIKDKLEESLGTINKQIPIKRKLSEGFNTNVKVFKCDWTPRKPEDYLLSNALCLHIREMIELQNAIEIDNVRNVLILNKSDFKNIVMNPVIYDQIQNIWVNQNIILNAEELKLLEAKGYKYIPREFFGQELREAAE